MKKGKEWLKKEIESDGVQLEYLYENYYTDDKAIMIDDVRHLIDQLDDNYTIEQPKLLTVIVKDYDETLHRQQVPKEVANEIVKLLQSTQREVTE